MKIYLWDNGWRGATFYIANCTADAIEYFRETYPNEFKPWTLSKDQSYESLIQEYEIALGLSIETQGD